MMELSKEECIQGFKNHLNTNPHMVPSELKLHLQLIVDGKMDSFIEKARECRELYKSYTKDQLY